jgi:hypothetical protein
MKHDNTISGIVTVRRVLLDVVVVLSVIVAGAP